MDKHRLKRLVRDAYSRLLWHSGLWRLVDRLAPRRLLVLAGHCVEDPAVNAGLPADMKIGAEGLERLLRPLVRRFRPVTVGEGVAALDAGEDGPSMVALSMDDGYRDNRTALLPLLERTGARCTVYLESRALLERRLNWSHLYFWCLNEGGLDAEAFARAYLQGSRDPGTLEHLRRALEDPGERAYLVKRVLKYHASPAERDPLVRRLFREAGGDEAALCERLYLSLDEARTLEAAGVELGGHTRTHEVLSTLDAAAQGREIEGGRRDLEQALGPACGRSFAYPFGRAWDHDEASRAAVRAAGFASAVTTHAGVNLRDTERTGLKRWMIDASTPVHLLMTEACGGFWLLRRLGLDLSE